MASVPSIPLLFGTIILPLVPGPALRYLCQSYVRLRVYWRLGFGKLAVAYLHCPRLEPHSVEVILCPMRHTLLLYVCYQSCYAWRLEQRMQIWTFCLILVLIGCICDVGVTSVNPTPVYFPFG